MTVYTLEDVQADLLEYADFEETNSVSRAQLFATAAMRWTILKPDSGSADGVSSTLNKQAIIDLMHRAKHMIASANNGGAVQFLGVANDFR